MKTIWLVMAVCAPALPTLADEPPPAPVPGPEASGSTIGLRLNAAGLLQFGLDPTLEIGGSHVKGAVTLRLLNTGLAPYLIATLTDEDASFAFGYGIGGGLRWYKGAQGSGFFVGPHAEIIHYKVDNEEDHRYLSVNGLLLLAEIGYRFQFASGFNLGLGGQAGAHLVVSEGSYDLTTDEEVEDDYEEPGRPILMFLVELGLGL